MLKNEYSRSGQKTGRIGRALQINRISDTNGGNVNYFALLISQGLARTIKHITENFISEISEKLNVSL